MKKKTYGAPRYMDWVAQIQAGRATMRVHFTGGALTVYGVTPAEYTTTNPFVQQVIEKSQYFKEGRIVLLKETEIDGHKAEAKSKPKEPAPKHPTTKPPTTEAEEPQAEESAEGMKEVQVSCLQDAQGYLQQNFGISSYKVRSKAAAQKAAAEHGVMFIGAGFQTKDNPKVEEAETEE